MPYVGRSTDKISNIEVLDNITFDGSSSYSITKGSVAFTPNSAQSCLISIDGVVQATNFTVSSSTIDFGVAVPSTSTCNFFLHYGTGVMTVPSDGSVTTAKLGDSAVTTAKITDANVTSAKLSYPLTTFSSTGIDDNADATAITIDSSERVGIGETSPSSKLHIVGSDATTQFKIEHSSASSAVLIGEDSSSNLRIYTGGAERMRINSVGQAMMGTESVIHSNAKLNLYMGASSGTVLATQRNLTGGARQIVFYNPNGEVGNIQTSGTTTAYNTSSDYRLKENVNYDFDATTRLKQLKPARFNFIADANTTVDGFIAHEVSSIVPEAISGEKDAVDENGNPEYQGIDQSKLVPLLVKTIQELEARITALESE